MFNLVLRYVIGGNTGKREVAVMNFAIWLLATGWVARQESVGAATEVVHSMWSVATPLVWTFLALAFGFEWASRQTRLGKGSPE